MGISIDSSAYMLNIPFFLKVILNLQSKKIEILKLPWHCEYVQELVFYYVCEQVEKSVCLLDLARYCTTYEMCSTILSCLLSLGKSSWWSAIISYYKHKVTFLHILINISLDRLAFYVWIRAVQMFPSQPLLQWKIVFRLSGTWTITSAFLDFQFYNPPPNQKTSLIPKIKSQHHGLEGRLSFLPIHSNLVFFFYSHLDGMPNEAASQIPVENNKILHE